jgi:hypothetical protein
MTWGARSVSPFFVHDQAPIWNPNCLVLVSSTRPHHSARAMKTDMLAYYQQVLDTISLADRRIFRKELRKAFKRLLPAEREQLKSWFRSSCVCKVQQPANGGYELRPAEVRAQALK